MSGERFVPTPEQILDWLEGRLSPEAARAVEAEASRPGSPAARFADWARDFGRLRGQLPLAEPPPLVSQRLRRLHAVQRGRVGASRRLVARLDIDSRQPDAMVALRGPLLEASSRIQLTFTTEAADVVLDVAPAGPGTVDLRGQVLPRRPMPPAFEATASGPSGSIGTIDGDELGSFVLEQVPVDTEIIVLTNDEVRIEVPLSTSPPST